MGNEFTKATSYLHLLYFVWVSTCFKLKLFNIISQISPFILRIIFCTAFIMILLICFKAYHPILFGMLLCMCSIIVRRIVIFFTNSWFFYLLILVFMGGVIVLIRYIRTLSANEKFEKFRFFIIFMPIVVGLRCTTLLAHPLYLYFKPSKNRSYVEFLYKSHNILLVLFLFLYLILAIVCTVKLVKLEHGPLVK